ncbi:MAG: RNA 2'-phosphotransferase [Planctomycetota bacterium]
MKSNNKLVSTSKFLSLVLRHRPEVIGAQLAPEGWLCIDELISQANAHGKGITLELLHEVVATNEKKRLTLSDDGLHIRASQGHSVSGVELNLEQKTPPEILYHGMVAAFLDSIRATGLQKRSRHHVHLSPDQETATKVGSRRGKPIILRVAAETMHRDGHRFYFSANGVWLVDVVPPNYLTFPE